MEGEYSICGSNIEFHAVVDRDSGAHLAILSARRPTSSVDLDRIREEGWRHPFEFRFGKHPVPKEGKQVIEDLRLGWEQFEQERIQAEAIKAEENLFRAWSALIQARSEQADSQQAVPYSDRTVEGNRITFRTKHPLDPAAVEQFWEVPITPGYCLRGLIDSVEGDLTTLYVEGSVPKSLPKTGVLKLDARSTRAALKREKDALDSVQFENCVRSELKQSILRPSSCTSNDVAAIDKWWFANIDVDKRDAVQRALATIIQKTRPESLPVPKPQAPPVPTKSEATLVPIKPRTPPPPAKPQAVSRPENRKKSSAMARAAGQPVPIRLLANHLGVPIEKIVEDLGWGRLSRADCVVAHARLRWPAGWPQTRAFPVRQRGGENV